MNDFKQALNDALGRRLIIKLHAGRFDDSLAGVQRYVSLWNEMYQQLNWSGTVSMTHCINEVLIEHVQAFWEVDKDV